jgi:hypothetical protein
MKRFTFTIVLTVCMAFLLNAQNFRVIPDLTGVTTVLNKYPFDASFGYSRTAVIYNKTDIGGSGSIYKIGYSVTTACPDSIPIVIKFKYSATPAWGGTGSYASLSTGATTVFQGKVKFNTGFNNIILQTPFNFSYNVNHLIIFTEVNYGATGSTTPPVFVCKPIDSSVDYFSHYWANNNSAPTGDGTLIDYQPLTILYFTAPVKPFSISGSAACNSNTLTWMQNAASDMVLIVGKAGTNTFTPTCFANYAAGDTVATNTVVVYAGSALTAPHTPVNPGTLYNYRAWSFNTSKIFSELNETASVLSAYNAPYSANFDGGSGLPSGWSGSMTVLPDHGVLDQALVAELQPPNVEKSVSTPVFCSINATSILEFAYRIVNISGYPGTATPANEIDTIFVQISTDAGHNYTTEYYITPGNHVAATTFETIQVPLGAYAGEGINVHFSCTRGSGSYFVDIDDFRIYDPLGIENLEENLITMYPNPTSNGQITIDLSAFTEDSPSIEIFNIAGTKVISEQAIAGASNTVNVQNLPAGIYAVIIMGETKRIIKKLIIL